MPDANSSQERLAGQSGERQGSAKQQAAEEASIIQQSANDWLLIRVGSLPKNSLGWFRCGVGFYNRKEYLKSIECFQKSLQLDPMNYNAYQIMARACIAVNRRNEAIEALKQSVNLDNPADWQLLVELTNELEEEQQQERLASLS